MRSGRITIIEPSDHASIATICREIWQYREVLLMLAWRDYKIRYRQTAIGIAWAVLQPVLAAAAFLLIFGRLVGTSDLGAPYLVYVFSGLILWQFFANSLTESSRSLVAASQMITKIAFPRIVIPLAKMLMQSIDLISGAIILVCLLAYFHIVPSLSGLVGILAVCILLALVTAALGILFSAVNVRFRDIQQVLPYFIQLGLFVTPVIYSPASLGRFRSILEINPLAGIIEGFHAFLFSQPVPWMALLLAIVISLLLFVFSLLYFARVEGDFSDII